MLAFQRLDVYKVARELARRVHEAKINDKELCDQATRAAKSTFLQLCEGLPNNGAAMRRKYFTMSANSLCETIGAVDLAAAMEMMSAKDAAEIQALGVRLKSMLRALSA